MKAGCTVSVPRDSRLGPGVLVMMFLARLSIPSTGALLEVSKHYWINRDNKDMKKDETMMLVDQRGNHYLMSKDGFVKPVIPEQTAE